MQPVKIREPIKEQKCRTSSCGAFLAASTADQELNQPSIQNSNLENLEIVPGTWKSKH